MDQSVPIISYAYTIPIASKMFNYKHVLHDLNIDDFKSIMWSTHKNNIDRGLVGGDNNLFIMEERHVFSNIWVFKDWRRASAHRPTEFFTSNCKYLFTIFRTQLKMKNWIYHHSTGFINYTSVLSNSAIPVLLGLPNAPRNLFGICRVAKWIVNT
jgi:hypothetical protein